MLSWISRILCALLKIALVALFFDFIASQIWREEASKFRAAESRNIYTHIFFFPVQKFYHMINTLPTCLKFFWLLIGYLLLDRPFTFREGKVGACNEMDGLHPGKTIFIFLNVMGVGWWCVLKENFLIAICWHRRTIA